LAVHFVGIYKTTEYMDKSSRGKPGTVFDPGFSFVKITQTGGKDQLFLFKVPKR